MILIKNGARTLSADDRIIMASVVFSLLGVGNQLLVKAGTTLYSFNSFYVFLTEIVTQQADNLSKEDIEDDFPVQQQEKANEE